MLAPSIRHDGGAVQLRDLSPARRAVHFADGEDWHANDAETSLMLAIAPEMVAKILAAAADDVGSHGGLVFSLTR